MATSHHKNRGHVPDENEAATHSIAQDSRRLKVIRNHAYDPTASAAGGKGGRSLPAGSQGEVNGGESHSQTTASVRRPYLKPAFQCDIVFSKALMQPAPNRTTT